MGYNSTALAQCTTVKYSAACTPHNNNGPCTSAVRPYHFTFISEKRLRLQDGQVGAGQFKYLVRLEKNLSDSISARLSGGVLFSQVQLAKINTRLKAWRGEGEGY